MTDTLRRLTSEPSIIVIVLTSLILFKTTFEKEAGTEIISVYLPMTLLVVAMYLFKRNVIPSPIKQISGNSGESLLWAGGSIAGFTLLYGVVNSIFRASQLATQEALSQSAYQSFFSALVSFSAVDFSQLTFVKYYLFGFLIPIIETITIINLVIFIGWIFDVSITQLGNPRVYGIFALVSTAFMYFHLKVRGIDNNIDLAMTFLFGFISLIIAAKTMEFEAANEFHIGTNLLALRYGV